MQKKIEFQAPEGFALPEDAEPGQPFEAMATLRQKEDGTLCLEAIDGAPLPKGDEEHEGEYQPTNEAPPPGFLESIEGGITQ